MEKRVKPTFMMVGNGNKDKNRKGTHSMDYTKELLNMTSAEGFMFGLLMDNRKVLDEEKPLIKSNQTYIDNHDLTGTQKRYLSKAYKKLREKDIIVRTRRQHYIINPRMVITKDNWKEDERLYIEAVEKIVQKNKKPDSKSEPIANEYIRMDFSKIKQTKDVT